MQASVRGRQDQTQPRKERELYRGEFAERAERKRQHREEQDLRRAWIALCRRYPWQWYGLLTFAQPMSEERLHQSIRNWLNGGIREGMAVGFAWMGEYGVTRHLHVHVLLYGVFDIERLRNAWYKRHGFATLKPYDPTRRGIEYMLKDCTTTRGPGFQISPDQERWAQQQAQGHHPLRRRRRGRHGRRWHAPRTASPLTDRRESPHLRVG